MPTLISTALIVGGCLACVRLSRLVRGRRALLSILLASYLLRVALALGFYFVSAYELPIFRSVQLPDGFWRFAWDATSYHANGVRIAEALRLGAELPPVMVGDQPFVVGSYDFFYLVGLVYWAFGSHPLYVPLLNATCWTAVSALSYALARRINGERAGEVAAAVIGFWPSSFIWSSQILKDCFFIFLLLSSIRLVMTFWEERGWKVLSASAALIPVVYLLARNRQYLVAALILAVGLSVGLTVALVVREARWRTAARGLALLGLLWVPFVLAPNADVLGSVLALRAGTPPAGHQDVIDPADSPTRADVPRELIQRNTATLGAMFSASGIGSVREEYLHTGGASNFAADVRLKSVWDMLVFLPRGLLYALYAPFPSEWFSEVGETGMFRTFAGIETVLMIALTPLLLAGVLRSIRARRMDAWLLVIFSTITIVFFALAIPNVGILFRLRLNALVPLFVLTSAYGVPIEKVIGFCGRSRSA